MKINTLAELYVDELKDLWSAEKHILKAFPRMIKAASAKVLKQAFRDHEQQSKEHVRRLEEIFRSLNASPRGKKCVGMEGLLKEGSELIGERPEADVLDAGLISAAQHVEHYEMAGYGAVRAWAKVLNHADHARLLQQTLNEEGDTDKALTTLAETINVEAEH
jgi:ferritin-like metal-binding protein YciE